MCISIYTYIHTYMYACDVIQRFTELSVVSCLRVSARIFAHYKRNKSISAANSLMHPFVT